MRIAAAALLVLAASPLVAQTAPVAAAPPVPLDALSERVAARVAADLTARYEAAAARLSERAHRLAQHRERKHAVTHHTRISPLHQETTGTQRLITTDHDIAVTRGVVTFDGRPTSRP